jgi:hypothetical protein
MITWTLLAALLLSPAPGEPLLLRSALVLESPGRSARSAVNRDAVEHMRVTGTWRDPVEGDTITLPDGKTLTWRALAAREDGSFRGREMSGGYAYFAVEWPRREVAVLRARGHRHVFVNGNPRVGDVYDLGMTEIPILLEAGRNTLLFKTGRGRLAVEIAPPPAEVFLSDKDLTLPDVVRGETGPFHAGVIVVNASEETQEGLRIRATSGTGAVQAELPPLPPLSFRKVAVRFVPSPEGKGDAVELTLAITSEGKGLLHESHCSVRLRDATSVHKRTFLSEIDGSVQYFAVTPQEPPDAAEPAAPSLYLSLHGASVEAIGQASCYRSKKSGVLVAPTNRRPYGFDWEDWGRLDALEVLKIAEKLYVPDPRRIYLTGHSMGGHGVWNLGAHLPGRFAAIAPSAGWCDFWSYTGRGSVSEDPVMAMLERAANPSRTLLLERNYLHTGIYVLHGDVDDNVPVTQARLFRERLGTFHPNFAYFEKKGAGHWWGNECMDWPPLFQFLERNILPEPREVTELEFVTVSPGISSRCHWLVIEAQERSLLPSRVTATVDRKAATFELTTENVVALALDLSSLGGGSAGEVKEDSSGKEPATFSPGTPISVRIDSDTVAATSPDAGGLLHLRRGAAGWATAAPRDPFLKSPLRSGAFKDAFRHRFLFVVGTRGSDAEDRLLEDTARYHAETFWYRGNGQVEIVRDTAFDPLAEPDRGVILYGNADTNAAWQTLLAGSPVQVSRGKVRIGERTLPGDDLAGLFVRPRPGSDRACVAVLAGTGEAGTRLIEQLPIFVSGAGFPDWMVLSAAMLLDGEEGALAAGFFGEGWSLREDDSVFRTAGRDVPRSEGGR